MVRHPRLLAFKGFLETRSGESVSVFFELRSVRQWFEHAEQ